jgi:hypothetical protein
VTIPNELGLNLLHQSCTFRHCEIKPELGDNEIEPEFADTFWCEAAEIIIEGEIQQICNDIPL